MEYRVISLYHTIKDQLPTRQADFLYCDNERATSYKEAIMMAEFLTKFFNQKFDTTYTWPDLYYIEEANDHNH